MGQVTKNAPDQMFESCTYTLERNKFLELTQHRWCQARKNHVLGKFITSISTEYDFRKINWNSDAIEYLEDSLKQAKEQGKHVLMGTHLDEQILFLKNHFGEDIVTIGINYKENMYPVLLNHMAEYHVYLLNNELMPLTEKDEILIESLSDRELIRYYANEFDQMNLIPRESISDCDYNIMIDDFLDPVLMENHMKNIGFPFTDNGRVFYEKFLKGHSTG
jgi:hypothetical protein